jgi:predicted nuclease of predicted toxin-antitoxin system
MFPPDVARALPEGGHDVVAVVERPELVALGDRELFEVAQRDGRVIVTENIADFAGADARYRADGKEHCGLLFVLKEALPRKRAQFVGAMARKLDAWLTEHPEADVPGSIAWPR